MAMMLVSMCALAAAATDSVAADYFLQGLNSADCMAPVASDTSAVTYPSAHCCVHGSAAAADSDTAG